MSRARLQLVKARCEQVGSCWEWISTAKCRERRTHPQMRLEKGGKPQLVRRVAYEAMYGEIPEGRYLVPICGSAFCVNPEHQKALTQEEWKLRTGNIAAASLTRSTSISLAWRKSGRTKLTLERANEIREAEGTLKTLAKQFGISSTMVGCIRRGELWRDHSSPFAGMFTQLAANDNARGRA